jgi:hypothetical protein
MQCEPLVLHHEEKEPKGLLALLVRVRLWMMQFSFGPTFWRIVQQVLVGTVSLFFKTFMEQFLFNCSWFELAIKGHGIMQCNVSHLFYIT